MKNVRIIVTSIILAVTTTSCMTDNAKVRETVHNYIYEHSKNPESIKILSCEIRIDTVPFYLSNELLNLAEEYKDALDKYDRYKDRGRLWEDEIYDALMGVLDARIEFEKAYKIAKDNNMGDIEIFAYVKVSGTNSIGSSVSDNMIFVIDKNEPSKILGTFLVDKEFILQFGVIKVIGDDYKFNTNKFGKYETEGMTYLEQFIMNTLE